MDIKQNLSLKEHSTMKAGGNARYLVEIADKAKLGEAVLFAKEHSLPIICVGGGSNILFDDVGFPGLVIKIANKGIRVSEEAKKLLSKEEVFVTAEAGEEWDHFVGQMTEEGFYGLENLSAIPGLVGGTPIQNIGAYGVEVGSLISEVEAFDTEKLEFKILSASDCRFAYRDSVFKKPEGKSLIVTSVTFKLSTVSNINISYKDLANHFGPNSNPSALEVRQAVTEIRAKKFPDLKLFGTAGSFFKNVICEAGLAESLKAKYPDLPVYDAAEGSKKISTAFILDKICGLKGMREGDVGLFVNQSLVVVNYGGASSEEIKNFISKIKDIVKEKTGINLEEEVVIV